MEMRVEKKFCTMKSKRLGLVRVQVVRSLVHKMASPKWI